MQFVEYTEAIELPDRERQLKLLSDHLNKIVDVRCDLEHSNLFRDNDRIKMVQCALDIESTIAITMSRTFQRVSELRSKERQKNVIQS